MLNYVDQLSFSSIAYLSFLTFHDMTNMAQSKDNISYPTTLY